MLSPARAWEFVMNSEVANAISFIMIAPPIGDPSRYYSPLFAMAATTMSDHLALVA